MSGDNNSISIDPVNIVVSSATGTTSYTDGSINTFDGTNAYTLDIPAGNGTIAIAENVYEKVEGLRLYEVPDANISGYGSKACIFIDGVPDENYQKFQGLMAGKSFQMRKLQCDENGNTISYAPGTQFTGMTWAEFGINDVDDNSKSTHYRIDKIKINGISHYFP